MFQSENRYRLCPFWSENNGFEGTTCTGVINIFAVSIPNELGTKSNIQIWNGFTEKTVCWPSNLSSLGPSSTLEGKGEKNWCGRKNKEPRGSLERGLSNDYVISTFVNMYVTFCDLLQVWKWVYNKRLMANSLTLCFLTVTPNLYSTMLIVFGEIGVRSP